MCKESERGSITEIPDDDDDDDEYKMLQSTGQWSTPDGGKTLYRLKLPLNIS